MLNAYCTFKLFLKVSLLQGVNTILQSKLSLIWCFGLRSCALAMLSIAVDALNLVVHLNSLSFRLVTINFESSVKFVWR